MSKTFGDRLKEVLESRGMSQSDLARLMFNSTYVDPDGRERVRGKEQISNYISGQTKPSYERYHVILKVLNLSPRDLPIKNTRHLHPAKYANKDTAVAPSIEESAAPNRRHYNKFPLAPSQGVLELPEPVAPKPERIYDTRELIEAIERLTDAINKLAN